MEGQHNRGVTAVRLWLDTNVARSTARLSEICSLARRKGVEVAVHPQVYLERRRQMRIETGPSFDAALFDSFLQRKGIQVPAFTLDLERAGSWADTLHKRYPSEVAWESAKQRTLGGELRKAFSVLPGDMPMTTDWLIALTVEHDISSWIITEDDGEEWVLLRDTAPPRVLRWNEALAWLRALPDASPSEPGIASP